MKKVTLMCLLIVAALCLTLAACVGGETYTITFSGTEQTVAPVTFKAGDAVTLPDVPQKAGYDGVWTYNGEPFDAADLPAASVELVARYTLATYSVIFKADGVQVGETQSYTIEDKIITEPTVPPKEGYTAAWQSYTLTTGDVTVNAVYTPHVYTIVYDKNGGTGTDMAPTSATYDADVTLSANTYEKTGHSFAGWKIGEETYAAGVLLTKPNFTSENNGSVTATAQWTVNRYTLTVNYVFAAGAQNTPAAPSAHSEEVAYGANYSVVSPTLAGYAADVATVQGTMDDVNGKTVTVTYSPRDDTPYTVQHFFENVSGAYEMDESKTQSLTGTTGTVATAVALTVEHYTEDETHEDRVASGVITAGGALTLKLYYALDRMTVTFQNRSAKENSVQEVRYGGTATFVARDGLFLVDAWQNCGVDFDFATPVTQNLTLQARHSHLNENFEGTEYVWISAGANLSEETTAPLSGNKSLLLTYRSMFCEGIRLENLDAVDFSDIEFMTFRTSIGCNEAAAVRIVVKTMTGDAPTSFTYEKPFSAGKNTKINSVVFSFERFAEVNPTFVKNNIVSIDIQMAYNNGTLTVDDVCFYGDDYVDVVAIDLVPATYVAACDDLAAVKALYPTGGSNITAYDKDSNSFTYKVANADGTGKAQSANYANSTKPDLTGCYAIRFTVTTKWKCTLKFFPWINGYQYNGFEDKVILDANASEETTATVTYYLDMTTTKNREIQYFIFQFIGVQYGTYTVSVEYLIG